MNQSIIARAGASSARQAVAAVVAIAIVVLALSLYRLGAHDVCGGDEGVEAIAVQQMVERGRLMFPLENGTQPMFKPPLFHWTATGIDRALGITKVDAFNLRLASVLYGTAGAILVMIFAYAMLGLDGAAVAGLTLAASYQYITQARYGRVDMTLAFFETLTLLGFLWWFDAPPRVVRNPVGGAMAERSVASEYAQYLCALAIGLAVLAKGPVGAILPAAAMGIFVISEHRIAEFFRRLSPGAIVVAILTGASWYLACYFGGRYGFLNRQLGDENFGRFFGSLGTMSPFYYVVPLFFNSAPLSTLAPVAVFLAMTARRPSPTESALDPGARREFDAMRLFAIFWIVTVVFFSIAAYKRRSYLLPLWPASALMIAWMVKRASSRIGGRVMIGGYASLCAILIVVNFFYIPHREVRECGGDSFRPAAEEIARVVGPDEPLFTYGFTEEIAPLLFYLDRDAPGITGKLGDAPPGYIIVPAKVWAKSKAEALDLEPVLESSHGTRDLILLRHGKVYAGI